MYSNRLNSQKYVGNGIEIRGTDGDRQQIGRTEGNKNMYQQLEEEESRSRRKQVSQVEIGRMGRNRYE